MVKKTLRLKKHKKKTLKLKLNRSLKKINGSANTSVNQSTRRIQFGGFPNPFKWISERRQRRQISPETPIPNYEEGHRYKIKALAVSNIKGSLIVSGDENGQIILWDSKTGKRKLYLDGHTASVNCLAFSPDDLKIVSGSNDTTVKLWNTNSGKCISKKHLIKHSNSVLSVAFSQSGDKFISGGKDGKIIIWNAKNGKSEQIIDVGSNIEVNSVAYAYFIKRIRLKNSYKIYLGYIIICGCSIINLNDQHEGCIRLYKAKDLSILSSIEIPSPVMSLVFIQNYDDGTRREYETYNGYTPPSESNKLDNVISFICKNGKIYFSKNRDNNYESFNNLTMSKFIEKNHCNNYNPNNVNNDSNKLIARSENYFISSDSNTLKLQNVINHRADCNLSLNCEGEGCEGQYINAIAIFQNNLIFSLNNKICKFKFIINQDTQTIQSSRNININEHITRIKNSNSIYILEEYNSNSNYNPNTNYISNAPPQYDRLALPSYTNTAINYTIQPTEPPQLPVYNSRRNFSNIYYTNLLVRPPRRVIINNIPNNTTV